MNHLRTRSIALLGFLTLGFVPSVVRAQGGGQAPAPAPQGPQITVGGLSYFQYYYMLNKNVNGINADNFQLTRAYINILAKLPGGVSARITPDIYQAADSTLNYRLKYAYVGFNPSGGPLTWKFGVTQTPLLDWEEALWDYRVQGTMPMERNGYVTSSDLGAGVDGNFNHEKVDLQAGVFNGEGYSKSNTGDQHKDVMARISFRLIDTDNDSRVGGLRLTVYGQYGMPNTGGARNRFLGMLSYRSNKALLAGEYAMTQDSIHTSGSELKGGLWAVYGWYQFAPKFRVIARADDWDPNTDASNTFASSKQLRTIIGLAYHVTPNFRVLADWDNIKFAADGTATPPSTAEKSTASQALLQMQFNF